jgi:hypothetical protein
VKDPALSGFAGRVSDSGEGRWTLKAAIDEGVPAPVPPPPTSGSAPGASRLPGQGPLGHALPVRRSPREAGGQVAMDGKQSDALVFGATGDLAYKKIFPRSRRW